MDEQAKARKRPPPPKRSWGVWIKNKVNQNKKKNKKKRNNLAKKKPLPRLPHIRKRDPIHRHHR
ncbi:hypothetical protein ACLMJO_11685, partial [Bifidobacterium longum]